MAGRRYGREHKYTKKSLVAPTMKDIHWAVGFLEGEGSFQFRHSQRVGAAQVQKEPLEKLLMLFGGSLVLQQDKRLNAADRWYWGVHGKRARGLMLTVYSLLSTKRKKQIMKSLVPTL